MNLNLRTAAKRQSQEPPPRSEEREKLADAIERRNSLVREIDGTEKALESLREQRRDDGAQKAVETAKAAIETAKANAAKYLTDSAMGVAGDPPPSVKDARAALQQAEDDFEMRETAWESLKAKLETDKDGLKWRQDRVRDRIREVVAADPSIRKLFVDYENLRRLMAQREILLNFFTLMTPTDLRNWQGRGSFQPGELQDETGPWREALAELERNADAPLPTMGA